LEDANKDKRPITISDLPDGLKDIADLPAEPTVKLISAAPSEQGAPIALPAATSRSQQPPDRPKTEKEQQLDALITKRQEVIEALKSKNPAVGECRRKITALLPALSGAGASHTMKLVEEAERLEFAISTEADTPKKEKDMIKRLRAINSEISKHKEIDQARKAVDAERSHLRSLMSEIKTLEHELFDARKACEDKYSEVLSERKAAYEKRQKGREDRARRQGEEQHRRFDDLRDRVRKEKKNEYDSEMDKYMKDYDDTVSMEEIVQIERKEKKEKKEE